MTVSSADQLMKELCLVNQTLKHLTQQSHKSIAKQRADLKALHEQPRIGHNWGDNAPAEECLCGAHMQTTPIGKRP